jgi:hypothetical protein
MQISNVLVLLALSLVWVGCEKKEAPALGPKAVSAQAAKPACDSSKPGATCTGQSSTAVYKIVFVGKEHACDCTRKRVDAAWDTLQKAIGVAAKVPVERVQIDTDEEKVALYGKQKPIMALPAIYFLDGKDSVVELLQGEITAEQIAKVLGETATAR